MHTDGVTVLSQWPLQHYSGHTGECFGGSFGRKQQGAEGHLVLLLCPFVIEVGEQKA